MYQVNIRKVRGKMVEKGYNITTLAQSLQVNRNTLSSYFDNPATIPYGKLSKMADLLCDTASEFMDLFFTTELT